MQEFRVRGINAETISVSAFTGAKARQPRAGIDDTLDFVGLEVTLSKTETTLSDVMSRSQKAKEAIQHNPIYTGVIFTLALLQRHSRRWRRHIELFYGWYQSYELFIIFGGGLVVVCALVVNCIRIQKHATKDADVEGRLNVLEKMTRKLCRHAGIDPDSDD